MTHKKAIGGNHRAKKLVCGVLTLSLLIGADYGTAASVRAAEPISFVPEEITADFPEETITTDEEQPSVLSFEEQTPEREEELIAAEDTASMEFSSEEQPSGNPEEILAVDGEEVTVFSPEEEATLTPDEAEETALFERDGGASPDAISGKWDDGCTWSFNEKTGELTLSGLISYAGSRDDRSDYPWDPYDIKKLTVKGVTKADQAMCIPDNAFTGYENLSEVSLTGVDVIGKNAFRDCTHLTSITIPAKNPVSVHPGAFAGCTALAKVAIPDDLIIYDEDGNTYPDKERTLKDIFPGCPLTSIKVTPGKGSKSFSAENNVIYSYTKDVLYLYPAGSDKEAFVVPNSVQKIANGAFAGATALKTLTIPKTLTTMGSFGEGCAITELRYTGTEQEFAEIAGMADALAALPDPPSISYEAAVVDPGEPEEDAEEDVEELANWNATGYINDEVELSVQLYHTGSTTYDGRKHVAAINPAKGTPVNPTATQNPDIVVKAFSVKINEETVPGITIKSFSYKNNMTPGEMQIYPTFAYDSKNQELQQYLKDYKALKTTLNKLVKPSYSKTDEEWSNHAGPITVTIGEIALSESTPVYNLNGMSKAEKAALSKEDGILVFNGKQEKIGFATYKVKEEVDWNDVTDKPIYKTFTYYIPTKVTVPGLYYQRVFDLGTDSKGNPRTATKKINLRAGGWSIKSKTYREDGESWTERWAEAVSGSYDYFFAMPDPESGYEKSDLPTYIQPVLNTEGFTVTKTKKVKDYYDEDERKWYYTYDEYEEQTAKPGYFTGSLPDFFE